MMITIEDDGMMDGTPGQALRQPEGELYYDDDSLLCIFP